MADWSASFVTVGLLGLVSIGMGLWVFVRAERRPGRWLVAALLVLWGFRGVVQGLANLLLADDPEAAVAVGRYWILPIVPPLLALPLYLPRPRAWVARGPGVPIAVLGAIVLLELLFMADRSLMDPNVGHDWGWIVWEGNALSQFTTWMPVLELGLAWWFAVEFRASWRTSGLALLVLTAGFALPSFYVVGRYFVPRLLTAQIPGPWSRWDSGDLRAWVQLALCFLLVAFLLGRGLQPSRRAKVRVVLSVWAVGLALGVVVGVSNRIPPYLFQNISGLPVAVMAFAAPLCLFVATLRWQFVDVQERMRPALERGALAGPFLLVLLAGSEVAQQYVDQALGWGIGTLAAAAVVVALMPLQRWAHRVSGAALPASRRGAGLSRGERVEVYREQLAIAWSDGSMTARERRLLDGLRRRLALTADEAAGLEAAVLRQAVRPGPGRRSKASAPAKGAVEPRPMS